RRCDPGAHEFGAHGLQYLRALATARARIAAVSGALVHPPQARLHGTVAHVPRQEGPGTEARAVVRVGWCAYQSGPGPGLMAITLQFVCGTQLSSRMIAWFGAGQFSHVDAVLHHGYL